jgi:hypothetical protein
MMHKTSISIILPNKLVFFADIGMQQLAAAFIIAKLMHSENRINYYSNKLLYSIIDMVRE